MIDETCKKENCEHYSIDDDDGMDICYGFPQDDDPTPTDDEVDRWDRAFHGDCPATECPWYKNSIIDAIDCIFMLSHPHRFNIGRLLAKSDEKGLYAEQIADEIDLDKDPVHFYLMKMKGLNLVSSEHHMREPASDPPTAVLYYKFTEKGTKIFDGIMNITEEPEKEGGR